MNEENER